MRLAPGRMDRSLWEGYPGCSLADSLDPGLLAYDPFGVRWRGRVLITLGVDKVRPSWLRVISRS